MSDKPKEIWLLTLFWGYAPRSKMHAIWGVRNFPDQAVPFLRPVIGHYVALKKALGDYILHVPKWDYVEAPIYTRDFVATRVDYFMQGEDISVKLSSFKQSQERSALLIQEMINEWISDKVDAIDLSFSSNQ